MKKKIVRIVLYSLMTIFLVPASCGIKTTPATTQPSTTITTMTTAKPTVIPITTAVKTTIVTKTTTGYWWETKWGVPQYGGTITTRMSTNPTYFDPWYAGADRASGQIESLYMETLVTYDWALDRKIYGYTAPTTPQEYRAGGLAESWEMPDYSTIIIHIRKGVKWQNKAPVNGREFTADDVVYTFNRQFGLGGGFTKMNPYGGWSQYNQMKSITAVDKYTVVVKTTEPTLKLLSSLTAPYLFHFFVAREVVDKYGNLLDWRNAVGTGAFMLQDFVSTS